MKRHMWRVVSLFVLLSAALVQPASAQDPNVNNPPMVDILPASTHPTPPPGWKQTCLMRAEDPPLPSPTCPVLRYNGLSYWVWADDYNNVTMMIAAYDAYGNLIQQWQKNGARYIWQINVDSTNRTVTFVGQANQSVTMSWTELGGPDLSNNLTVANISLQSLNCLAATNCQPAASDTSAAIPLPPSATGNGQLITRTIAGQPGAPAAGKTIYAYRVDLTGTASPHEGICATDLTVNFGPITRLNYANNQPADVFVVNQGGPGSVGLFSAMRSGADVVLTFNQPICTSRGANNGLFFGVASGSAPKAVTTKLGWAAVEAIDVPARGPAF